MSPTTTSSPRRGRPPGPSRDYTDARESLIRSGMELLTEQGFTATGLDVLLKRVGVPKGSFYHYFESKEAFGREVMAAYDAYFCAKLDRWLLDDSMPPLERLLAFLNDAKAGMARHEFKRGCLVGNLGQEIAALPHDYRERLAEILQRWQDRVSDCLRAAQHRKEVSAGVDCDALAAFFWISWEGAVLRARLMRDASPLDLFVAAFFSGLLR